MEVCARAMRRTYAERLEKEGVEGEESSSSIAARSMTAAASGLKLPRGHIIYYSIAPRAAQVPEGFSLFAALCARGNSSDFGLFCRVLR